MNLAEEGVFQLPPFPNKTSHAPDTFQEAQDRGLIYVAHNMRQIDAGNPNFGNVAVVFRRDYAWNMTLMSPVDTGTRY